MAEKEKKELTYIINSYLNNYIPTDNIDYPGLIIKTTDDILRDLNDMADFEPNQVASILLLNGFITGFHPDGRHGWLMLKR